MWRSMCTPLKGQSASPPWPCSATTSGCRTEPTSGQSGRANRQRTLLPGQNLEENVPSSKTTPAGLSMPGLQATSHGMATTHASTPRRLMSVLTVGTLAGSPARHGRRHEIAEQRFFVDGQTTADEPGAHVVTVALKELRAAGVADDVDDLRPVDDDESVSVEQDVVRRQVTVGPAAQGQLAHRGADLFEEVCEQRRVRAGLGQSRRRLSPVPDELHQDLRPADLHRVGDRQSGAPQLAQSVELRKGPLARDQLLAESGAPCHGAHLAAAPDPATLEV